MYIIGKSGSGKTNLLETLAINDIRAGRGLGVIDPHGEFAEKMLDFIPESRIKDVIYFNPSDIQHPIAFNPLEQVSSEFRHLVASGIMGVFKKIWVDAWSARMEYILNNTLLALLEYPNATILGVMRMFSDPEYRKVIVTGLKDPVIKGFWTNEYARYSQKFETEAVAAIQNKIGQFVSNPLIRNIIGQPRSSINMRDIMDGKKILIANLSKGKMGEDNSRLLGAMMITRIQLAAMSRVDIPEKDRSDFFLYVDEFQNFATDSFASILSEARKYRLSLILAHQYIEQLDEKVQPAVFGNVGTLTCFRVGGPDAEFLEKEFMPEFEGTDLVNLEKYNIYIKLLIDGMAGRPFSAKVLPPLPLPSPSFADVIIDNSRRNYALPKAEVEEKIASEWLAASAASAQPRPARGRSDEPLGRAPRDIYREGPRREPQGQGYSGQEAPRQAYRQAFRDAAPRRQEPIRQEERREPIREPLRQMPEKTFSDRRDRTPSNNSSTDNSGNASFTKLASDMGPKQSILAQMQQPRPKPTEVRKSFQPNSAVSEKEAALLRDALRERLRNVRRREG